MKDLNEILKDIKSIATARSVHISTAESCTGGLISKYLTDEPGSSSYFSASIITYSNQSKIDLLGVSKLTLEEFGAVSREVVEEMSHGLINRTSCDYALSVSGIMGPSNDKSEKDVGTVWINISSKDLLLSKMHILSGSREINREETARLALNYLYDFIKGV